MVPTILGQDSVLPSQDGMGVIEGLSLPPIFHVHQSAETSLEFTPGHFPDPEPSSWWENRKGKGAPWGLS